MELEMYQSSEAYMREAMEWVRSWIRLYREYAVSLDERGKLLQIRGSIVFGDDLELSLEGGLEPEERQEYEKQADRLRDWLKISAGRAAASFRGGIAIPMEYLFRVFGLEPAERFCVLMALAPEYDRTMGRMFSLLQDDYKEKYPSLDLCLKIYTSLEEERSRIRSAMLSGGRPFRLFFQTEPEHAGSQLKLHPRIWQFLHGFEETDRELEGIAKLYLPPRKEGQEAIEPEMEKKRLSLARAAWRDGSRNLCFVYGPEGSGRKTLVRQAAAEKNRPVLTFDLRTLCGEKNRFPAMLGSIVRECRIRGAAPCGIHGEALLPKEGDSEETKRQKERIMGGLLRELTQPGEGLFLTSEKRWEGPWLWPETVRTDWEVPFPDQSGQIRLWEKLLSGIPVDGITPQALTVRFSLTPGQMTEALKEAAGQADAAGETVLPRERLYEACRRQLVMHLGDHVTQIQTRYQWEDLVLPPKQKEALQSACNQVEYSHQVYDLWGFDRKVAYGKGVSLLFYGPPGTGKTMGAQVMANRLSMELYKVDLSSVMSKYIGETEKNLGRIFDEVKKSRSILFFDEADALFGKRTEVKDSHDKYANAETAYLLQKIEEYQGIVILATNYMQNFDEAFKRRIKFIIEFPFPLAPYRMQMWKQVFPEQTPLEDLDYEYLAERFELSGSSIKNIAVAAAFLAAAEGGAVGMKQILLALKDEMVKSGKSMPPESFGEYYGLVSKSGW